ncbi:MAG: Serine/threonine kinase [uncultured Rubrobacteraceae bacterium]|uniref:Serine/threonine kinase n=1 Tax=uncultured Rubrobacteraceae bacterium TaxID=349277 RepID=A0A6J4RBB7_9ACTN|nr:MAG: Serine/threonine kinase [uncultured Rubrobacteraceae bacterium]
MQDSRELTDRLIGMLVDSRKRTLELVSDLSDEQMIGPQLRIVNPPLWEIGHLAWFQERWNLRRVTDEEFAPSTILGRGDEFYDSMQVAHDTRWELPLLSREETLSYMRRVLDETLHSLRTEGPSPEADYFARLAAFHEDMHGEAFTYTRQTHGLPAPPISEHDPAILEAQPRGPLEGDAEVPGGEFMLGATEGTGFVFDNEKWAHPVRVSPFRISRAPVTNEQFGSFVDDGAYRRRELWGEEGRRWLDESGAERPVYWSRVGDGWHHRHFDSEGPLNPHAPVIHVGWYEAEAYCRWAERRLPTEAEWEMAASAEPDAAGTTGRKRLYPWGDGPPGPRHANLDGRLLGPVDVAAFPEGDSAFGCRQMVGNVWEWCADDFGPYPGFVRDPYKDYSEPWFGDHKVQRGGSWATRSRMLRNTWRNFALPDRRDVFAGFRTCALD